MKNILIHTLLILSVTNINAQDYFFNYVDGWMNNFSVEVEEGYILSGLEVIDGGGGMEHEYAYNVLDFDGDNTNDLSFFVDQSESTSTGQGSQIGLRFGENEMIICGTVVVDFEESIFEGSIVKYDIITESFEIVYQTTAGATTQFYNITQPNDSTFYVAGRIFTEGAVEKIVFYEFDFEGNERWHRDFTSCQFCLLTPTQILPLANGNIAYIYHNIDFDQGAFQDRETGHLVMMDSVGEILWETSIGDEENFRITEGGVVEIDDELMVVYSQPYYYDEEGEWQANIENTYFITKYNLEGDWLSTVLLNEVISNASGIPGFAFSISQMQLLEDQNILISGSSGVVGLLVKVSPAGEVIWFNTFTPHSFDENPVSQHTQILHTLPTSDGGFLCTGQYRSDPGDLYPGGIQTAIALKVDEYGCLEEDCQVGIEENEMGSLEVYPNPSEGRFVIELPALRLRSGTSNLSVFNTLGAEIYSDINVSGNRFEIDLSGYSGGLYMVFLETEGGSYSSKIIKK